jgi:hypothetical protein
MFSHHDTRGRLYPNALNQLFTGIYIMEMCLLGLFLLVRDEHQRSSCKFQAAVMIIVTGLTVTFQILLNRAFAPLLQFLSLVSADQCRESGDVESRMHLEHGTRYEQRGEKINDHSSQHYDAHTRTFQNEALCVKRPVVWIPKDTIGISGSELYQTKILYPDISTSNENASMKSNGDLVVGRNPPDL